MSGRRRRPSEKELHKLVRQLCGEEPYGAEAWMKLRPEDFEPFFCADDVCLLESPVVSAGAAPSWGRRAVDEMLAEAGRTVTHFRLHIGSSGRALSLDMLSEIVTGAQNVIDLRSSSFVVGYQAMGGLKEGEVTLSVLASVGPEPRPEPCGPSRELGNTPLNSATG